MEMNNIPPLKIVNNGNRFFIQNTETSQPSMETKQSSNLARTEKRVIKIDNRNSLTKLKKRKISEQKNNNNNSSTPLPTKWLQDIPISNSYDILDDSTETQNTTGKAVEEKKAVKPPPIYIDAEIIDPLLELLDETAGQNNYIIKQLKDNQVKIQTTTPDTFRKHPNWGSKTTSPRGKILNSYITNANLDILTTGEPTYWPLAFNKTPDLIDFGVLKGLNLIHCETESLLDLSSDHSPIIITYQNKPILYKKSPTLCNGSTNWMIFKEILESKLNFNIPLKTSLQIENAVNNFTDAIQEAAWASTSQNVLPRNIPSYPSIILHKIKVKRQVKTRWQKNKTRSNKRLLKKVTKDVKQSIRDHNNAEFEKYLTSLSPHEDTNYSL
ncbi:hypothetical protein M0802_009993 [Mischocyttarus mexicanus]|nr:hypothetical protein M0802_009993 [Mischocyttarus mexicanus]